MRRPAPTADELLAVERAGGVTERWSRESYVDELSSVHSRYFGFYEGAELAGFVLYREDPEEISILHLAVRTKGRGEGRRLLDAFVAHVRSTASWSARLLLEVSMKNEVAYKLYLKSGFHQIGKRKKYYADGSDAAVMIYDLKGNLSE